MKTRTKCCCCSVWWQLSHFYCTLDLKRSVKSIYRFISKVLQRFPSSAMDYYSSINHHQVHSILLKVTHICKNYRFHPCSLLLLFIYTENFGTLNNIVKQYGKCARVWIGPELNILISDPKDVEVITILFSITVWRSTVESIENSCFELMNFGGFKLQTQRDKSDCSTNFLSITIIVALEFRCDHLHFINDADVFFKVNVSKKAKQNLCFFFKN